MTGKLVTSLPASLNSENLHSNIPITGYKRSYKED